MVTFTVQLMLDPLVKALEGQLAVLESVRSGKYHEQFEAMMNEALIEVTNRTPVSQGVERNRSKGIAKMWHMEKTDEDNWLISHEGSEPGEHPLSIIIRVLEGGSKAHDIAVKGADNMWWLSPELAAKFKAKYGENAWAEGDYVVIPREVTLKHPGTQPHWMVRLTAEGVNVRAQMLAGDIARDLGKATVVRS